MNMIILMNAFGTVVANQSLMGVSEIVSITSAVALTIITTYYAIITHRMLKYNKDMTMLAYRPLLKLEEIYYIIGQIHEENYKGIVMHVKLKNVSQVLLKYEMSKSNIVFLERKNSDPKYLNNGGYVYPDQTVDFSFPFVCLPDELPQVLTGELEYEFTYFSSIKKKYKSYRKLSLFIDLNSQRLEWKSLNEKEEEL